MFGSLWISKMSDKDNAQPKNGTRQIGFLESLLRGFVSDILWLLAAFLIATAITALVFWVYNIPIALSIIGGILVLGIAIAIRSGGSFFD